MESSKKDVDYGKSIKVHIDSNKLNDDQLKVHQLKSLESFSRSTETLGLSITPIGDNRKEVKERRKKKTRSVSRDKQGEREKPSDYGVSRDTGESFISAILANVQRNSYPDHSEEERLRLMNLRLEARLGVTNQASVESLQEQTQLRCKLEIAQREAEANSRRLDKIENDRQRWSKETDSLLENNSELDRRTVVLRADLDAKIHEFEIIKAQAAVYQDSLTERDKCVSTIRADVAMKESVIADLKKKVGELYSQLELIKLYGENSEYQAEQVRLELTRANNSRLWVEEQLRTVESVRDQLQAEVQRVRKNLDESCNERDSLSHQTRSLEIRLTKLQDMRLHDTTQLLFELEQLQKEIILGNEERDILERQYASLTSVYDEKIQELEKERMQSRDLQRCYDEMCLELSDVKKQLAVSRGYIDSLEGEASELRKSVAVLNGNLVEKECEIRALESESEALHRSLHELQSSGEQKDHHISVLTEDLTNVSLSLDRVRVERDQSALYIANLRDDCEKVAEQFDLSRQNLFSKEESLRLVEEMNEEMRAQLLLHELEIEAKNVTIDDVRREKEQLMERCVLLQSGHTDVRQQLDQLRHSLNEANMTMVAMERDMDELRTENRFLESSCREAASELTRVKSDLAQAQRGLEELDLVQQSYTDLLQRHQVLEEQLLDLAGRHKTLNDDFETRTQQLELRLHDRESELEKMVALKEEIVQCTQKDLQTVERARSQLTSDLENVRFASVVELATKEQQFREKLEKSEQEFSQMCQEKIRCESAIGSLKEHIGHLVEDYNGQLKDCKATILNLRQKSTDYKDYEEKSRSLMEELERKKGELEGMLHEWKKMKTHAGVLETALARREASLHDLVGRHSDALTEKDALIEDLRRQLRRESERCETESSAKGGLKSQLDSQVATLEKLGRQLSDYGYNYGALEQEVGQWRQRDEVVQEENRLLKDTQEHLRTELERLCAENRQLMTENQSLNEQVEMGRISDEGKTRTVLVLKQEVDQKTRRITESGKKREKLVQRYNDENREMKSVVKNVQHERESLTRTAELSQQREVIASSMLSRLRSEVKRILFEENISSGHTDEPVKSFSDQYQQLQKLLKETEVPIRTTKPLSRLSKCIEDLRSQVDSMQGDVLKNCEEELASEAAP